MWSEHPDIAKRWAHEYPESNKNLPLYAQKSKGEKSEADSDTPEETKKAHYELLQRVLEPFRKASESVLKEVKVPRSEKPVAAGDAPVTAKCDALNLNNDKTTYPAKKPMALESLFNLQNGAVDKDSTTPAQKYAQVQEIKAILTKLAVVLRPGKAISALLQQEHDPRLLNSSIDVQKLQQSAQREAQMRMFSATPLPLGAQQNQPVATYAGTQPQQAQKPQAQPAKQPNVMSNTLTNVIGRAGALNSKNGVPTKEQNVTGTAAFGVNQA